MDFITEAWKELPAVMQWAVLPWLAFTISIYFSLKHEGRGRERFLTLIADKTLQKFYRKKLKQWMDYTAKSFFNDKDRMATERKRRLQANNRLANVGFFNTYSEASYAFLLRLALFYPIFFLLITWFFSSHGGEIGDFQILEDGVPFSERLLLVTAYGFVFFFFLKGTKSSGFKALIYYAVAFAVAVAVAVAFAVAGAGAVTFAVGSAVAVVFDYLYIKSANKPKHRLFYWLFFFTFFITYLLGIVYWLGLHEGIKIKGLPILIFLGLLPLVNSPFDWISLGITRSLLYSIVDKVHGGVIAFFWSVFDIVIALLLLFGIMASTTAVISFANYLFQQGGHYGPIIDLNLVFNDLQNNPFDSRYTWLYLMFLSTLIPTFVHLMLAAWAVISWIPSKVLKRLSDAKKWKEDQQKYDLPKLLVVTFYHSIFMPVAFFAPALVLYGLHLVLIQQGYVFVIGETLLDSMQSLAHWVNPLSAFPLS